MGQARQPTCPDCGAYLTLALPPGGKGRRTFQCLDCEGPGGFGPWSWWQRLLPLELRGLRSEPHNEIASSLGELGLASAEITSEGLLRQSSFKGLKKGEVSLSRLPKGLTTSSVSALLSCKDAKQIGRRLVGFVLV
jgi:hypothetical protein